MIPEYRTVIFGRILLGSFITEVMAFGALLSVIHAVEFQRRGMEQTAQAARLETLLAEAEILAGLGDEAHRWLETLDASHDVTIAELNGMLGSIAHLAYHLGAIRQIDRSARGPKEGTFPGAPSTAGG